MQFTRFEDIVAWQRSKIITLEIYKALSGCRDFSFRDQIQRAAVSMMNNIAEGYERKSNNEFKHFLYIAKGSSGEVRSMLNLAVDLEYISKSDYEILYTMSIEVSKILSGLIKTL